MTMKSPYEILGVSERATLEEIEAAYKRLAKQLHPDVGGEKSKEAFQELNAAYQILKNPDERAHYDAHGSARNSKPKTKEERAWKQVIDAFLAAVHEPSIKDPTKVDLIALVCQMLENAKNARTEELIAPRKELKRLRKVSGRFKKKAKKSASTGTSNRYQAALDWQIGMLKHGIELAVEHIEILEMAIELAGEYDYEHESPTKEDIEQARQQVSEAAQTIAEAEMAAMFENMSDEELRSFLRQYEGGIFRQSSGGF